MVTCASSVAARSEPSVTLQVGEGRAAAHGQHVLRAFLRRAGAISSTAATSGERRPFGFSVGRLRRVTLSASCLTHTTKPPVSTRFSTSVSTETTSAGPPRLYPRAMKMTRPHFAAGEHAHREGQPFARFGRGRRTGERVCRGSKAAIRPPRRATTPPRHHRLRRRDGGGRGHGVGGSGAGHQRHAHSHEQHEEERDARGDAAFGGRVDMPAAHQHPDDEAEQDSIWMLFSGRTSVSWRGRSPASGRADRDRRARGCVSSPAARPTPLPAPADGEQR